MRAARWDCVSQVLQKVQEGLLALGQYRSAKWLLDNFGPDKKD